MSTVRLIRPHEAISLSWADSIVALENRIWPPTHGAPLRTVERSLERWKERGGIHCLITHDEDASQVLAHSFIFRRDIFSERGSLSVGALASVCVDPAYRGRGWGADVVRAAFGVLPELGVAVSLFQTGVPQFYEKLGCRAVSNLFYNGRSADKEADPFWNSSKMIYPAPFSWPDGPIDINGEGY